MRRKIVLWGSNEKDEKMLVALELLEKENVVNIYTFPESLATEDFYKAMSEKWRDDIEVEFPAGFTKIERKLSISDSLLPDEIRVKTPDVITRAQAEWHFVVLSSKLYDLYKSELEEIKEKVESVSQFDNHIWDELKTFWGKVQGQVNDRNLFREHGAALREKTNGLFEKLKEYKKSLEAEFETQSKTYVESFKAELQEIEDKIEKGLGLNPIFDDLKAIQQKLNGFKFTKEDRNEVWNKIDESFKKLKEKRSSGGGGGQGGQGGGGGMGQLENRYKGLIAAIDKMQKSINFDLKDLEFENKRIANSDGQLETMLRQAKLNMINERIKSKEEKLLDMNKTKADIESRMDREKKRANKSEKSEQVEAAKEIAKAKIASEIATQTTINEEMAEKLSQAAADFAEQKGKKKASEGGILEKLSESIENLVEDLQDSAAAVAAVVGDKIEEAMEKAEDVIDKIEDKVEDSIEALKKDKDDDKKDEEDKKDVADAKSEEE